MTLLPDIPQRKENTKKGKLAKLDPANSKTILEIQQVATPLPAFTAGLPAPCTCCVVPHPSCARSSGTAGVDESEE